MEEFTEEETAEMWRNRQIFSLPQEQFNEFLEILENAEGEQP